MSCRVTLTKPQRRDRPHIVVHAAILQRHCPWIGLVLLESPYVVIVSLTKQKATNVYITLMAVDLPPIGLVTKSCSREHRMNFRNPFVLFRTDCFYLFRVTESPSLYLRYVGFSRSYLVLIFGDHVFCISRDTLHSEGKCSLLSSTSNAIKEKSV